MSAQDAHAVVERIRTSIDDGRPKELMRAACFSLVIADFDGYDAVVAERVQALSTDWWARYETLTDDELDQLSETIIDYYRALYRPAPPETPATNPSAPSEPSRGTTASALPPITTLEAELFVASLESEDRMREFAHYARLVGADGSLPVEPLLVVDGRSVYGHAIAPLYREGRIDRPWGARRRRWEYALMEDTLLARCASRGQLTGRERNRTAFVLVPYMPLLEEKAIRTHLKRIESGLVTRGCWSG